MIAHFDLDAIKHAAACAGETRSVKVVHKTSGRELDVPTRTDFYGHWKKKEGGLLAEINSKRKEAFLWDGFDYIDIQVPEPVENVLHSAKLMVEKAIVLSGAASTEYYIGKGESFRVELSTLLKYKANRTDILKAVLLDEVSDYLIRKFKAQVVTHLENDDAVVMNSYGKKDHFVLGAEKDFLGCGSKFFNFRKPELGIMDTNCYGKLWLDSKGEPTGFGRMFKLFQVCGLDSSDNYAANCMSDTRWGAKSSYNALKDCKSDKELFTEALKVFNKLYPEPKTVAGWRGEDIQIDALYVFQECFNMAHLHRWDNDYINVKDVLDKLGVGY